MREIGAYLTEKLDELVAANDEVLERRGIGLIQEMCIRDRAEGLRQIADLEDPIGATLWEKVRPNGLRIGKRVVPLGVVGIIYESRPNVTADAFGLCFKTGNVVILRGGSDAIPVSYTHL